MKSAFDLRSLPFQMILSFIAVVVLTVVTAGLPAIWLIREQLDRQAWFRVEQGQNAAQALYISAQNQIANAAMLTAQRPTLQNLLVTGDLQAIRDYLTALQVGEGLDLITICAPQGTPLLSTLESIPENLCDLHRTGSYYFVDQNTSPQVWLLAATPLNPQGDAILVGIHLDQEFATQMRSQTGLEHTLIASGQIAASSASAMPQNVATVTGQFASAPPEDVVCCTYELSGKRYYAARISLNGTDLEAEVALPVADITTTQTHLGWILAGSMLLVAVLGSGMGIFLARRISRPLVRLSETAIEFSKGDLSTPVVAETRVREVVQVSRALENARIDLQKTMTELRQEKAWSEHLLESIVEGIMILDHNLQITFFSHGAERITGWGREEVLYRSCDKIFQLAEPDNVFSRFIPVPGMRNKIVVQLADGRQASLSVTRARLAPSEADANQIVLVFRDVSEEEIIHRLLGHFMANIAHEFRTPLSALAASIELLLDQGSEISPDEMEGLLKTLHLGILSLQTLVDNLLESASIDAGHFRVSARPYDLEEIIREVTTTMQPLLEKYGQWLKIDLPEAIPLVSADPRRIGQVLVNLLSNAIKYGPPDAEITLSATVEGGWVRVKVADRGPGVSTRRRNVLFRRFEFPDTQESNIKVGAGLGLSVVKAIVEAHGGQAEVDDRPGGGSIFWFTLPIASET